MHFSRNGRFLISGVLNTGGFPKGTCTVSLWDTHSLKEIWRIIHNESIDEISLSPDEHYFATASDDHTSRVYDLFRQKEIGQLSHDDAIHSLVFSRDSKYIVTTSRDQTARVWETKSGRELVRLNHDGEVFRAGFSADNEYVLTTSMDRTQRLWLWRPEDLIQRACDNVTRNLTHAEWSSYFRGEPYQPTCRNLPTPGK